MRRLMLSLFGSAIAVAALVFVKVDLSAPGTAAVVATAPGTDGAARTVKGTASWTPYGTVQVQVTFSGQRIVDVTALQLPQRDRHSRQLASYAEPVLRQEAIDAQSATIDAVSGATYTSQGYAESLQSAIDSAK